MSISVESMLELEKVHLIIQPCFIMVKHITIDLAMLVVANVVSFLDI